MDKNFEYVKRLKTFNERLDYLMLKDKIGNETFGNDRWINQKFYTSKEWKQTRDYIIVRDCGCDLAVEGIQIFDKVFVHHINPITRKDLIEYNTDKLFNPNNLICVSFLTHNMIHYGIENKEAELIQRYENDTCPWKI